MEFPKKIKKKARAASAYTCCMCHRKFIVQVHHINPELSTKEGLHDFKNAAPLCAQCHADHGNDPTKREYIRDARDWWYDTVKKQFGKPELLEPLDRIIALFEESVTNFNIPADKNLKSDIFSQNLITPFYAAENHFLEVLVPCFTLTRNKAGGVELKINFNDNTPSIWRRKARYEIINQIQNFEKRSKMLQDRLDNFIFENKGKKCEIDEEDFHFRYVSGGALPIIKVDGYEYYCLLYRTIFPVGWNIANGGSDNRTELLNPLFIIKREFLEELIIFSKDLKNRYILKSKGIKSIEFPEFIFAMQLWQKIFKAKVKKYQETEIEVELIKGSDSIEIKFGNNPPIKKEGFFLNINAEDFGIELDMIIKIPLDKKVKDYIFLDGEIIKNNLVKSPIGLFEVKRLNKEMNEKGKAEFIPDFLYLEKKLHKKVTKEKLNKLIYKKYLPYINRFRFEEEKELYESTEYKFDLCPVTKRILKRYQQLH